MQNTSLVTPVGFFC